MFLNDPFPPNSSFKSTIRFSFFAGLIVFLILFLFKPFNIDGAGNHPTIWHPLLYGLATFVMVALNALLLPLIFPAWFQEKTWTLGRELLAMCWQIVSISFVNLVITHFLFGEPLDLPGVAKFLLITFSVGIFPVTFILLIKQQLLYKKFAAGASVIEHELQASKPEVVESVLISPIITLVGDNQGEELLIPVEDLRYISSADNYLRVFYLERGELTSRVIRSSLKKVELMTGEYPFLFRCHRTFIVNLNSLVHVSGNAQGFKLQLKDVDEVIPVSRVLNTALREKLQQHQL